MPRRSRISIRLFALPLSAALALVFATSSAHEARADGLSSLGIDANSLVSSDVVKALVTFVGFGTQHRPYEPATPLGLVAGVDLSLEVTLFKVPDSLLDSMSSMGSPASASLRSLPIPKLHFHKGLGDLLDIGSSLFYVQGNWLVGADAKFVLSRPEEGPTFAFRFCFSYSDLNFSSIQASTKTFSPQLLLSRQMAFADPYLGIAFEYARGDVKTTVSPVAGTSIEIAPPAASDIGGYAFGGVSLRIPRSGMRMTLEGSYNTAGTSTMGTKLGFTF